MTESLVTAAARPLRRGSYGIDAPYAVALIVTVAVIKNVAAAPFGDAEHFATRHRLGYGRR
jgi:hypothetical protein